MELSSIDAVEKYFHFPSVHVGMKTALRQVPSSTPALTGSLGGSDICLLHLLRGISNFLSSIKLFDF